MEVYNYYGYPRNVKRSVCLAAKEKFELDVEDLGRYILTDPADSCTLVDNSDFDGVAAATLTITGPQAPRLSRRAPTRGPYKAIRGLDLRGPIQGCPIRSSYKGPLTRAPKTFPNPPPSILI
jgi:hypothetical protein